MHLGERFHLGSRGRARGLPLPRRSETFKLNVARYRLVVPYNGHAQLAVRILRKRQTFAINLASWLKVRFTSYLSTVFRTFPRRLSLAVSLVAVCTFVRFIRAGVAVRDRLSI